MKNIGIGFAALVGILLLTWVFQGNSFFLYKIFAPRQEEARREVYEQSHAYRQGMVQELQQMQLEYLRSEPAHRSGIASLILHRASDISDEYTLPSDLRGFISCVRSAAPSYTNNCN